MVAKYDKFNINLLEILKMEALCIKFMLPFILLNLPLQAKIFCFKATTRIHTLFVPNFCKIMVISGADIIVCCVSRMKLVEVTTNAHI